MRVALVGATGRTGQQVLSSAVRRGHDVTVLVRDTARLPADLAAGVRVVVGDVTDAQAVAELLDGADAVVSALGPSGQQTRLHERAAEILTTAMERNGPRRFVGVSGAGIDVPGDRKRPRDRVISALIQRLGGEAVRDKPAEYAVWAASPLDWTLVRPPRLKDGPATGRLEHDAHTSTRNTSISRADLAAFLLDCAEQGSYPRQAPFVATAR